MNTTATTNLPLGHAEGDYVIIKSDAPVAPKYLGVLYRVASVTRQNAYITKAADPSLRLGPIPLDLLLPAPNDLIAQEASTPPAEPIYLGTPVTVSRKGWKYPASQVWVVVAMRNDGYNLAKLGGDENRYVRNVPRADLTPVRNLNLTHD